MADILNRTTGEFLRSVHEPNYPVQDWIHNPDLSAVVGFASKYWVITGDVVTLMNQADRDAIDAAELVARLDAEADQLGNLEGVLRAVLLILLNDRNGQAGTDNSILSALRTVTSLSDIRSKATAIPDTPIYTEQQLRTAIRNRLGS